MTVLQLGILALVATLVGQLKRGREPALLAVSVFIIFWLQPSQQFVSLAFWLPAFTLSLTILVWLTVSPPEIRRSRLNWPAALIIAGVVLLVDFNQFFGLEKLYMTTTPRIWMVALGLISFFLVGGLFLLAKQPLAWCGAIIAGILLLFVYLKSPFLIAKSFDLIHRLRGQQTPDAHSMVSWLGFSYVAFRLMHTLRDAQAGRLPALTLSEYVNYVIFFPSIAAGPIDRAERFVLDLRNPAVLTGQDWVAAGRRFFVGMFKKFVIADSLGLIAINDVFVAQVHSPAWLWFFLYMYSLRIYFDFSGYTDVAISLARLTGIRLPENFASPYLKPNLTQFWNSWHMTLTQWFRAYIFNPLTRTLRTRNYPVPLIILVTQVGTMFLIGLWHGIAWSFVSWGVWHGLGLFVQNRWSEFIRARIINPLPRTIQLIIQAGGIFITFNFVSLGWLFFTLPSPDLALATMSKLFGVGV